MPSFCCRKPGRPSKRETSAFRPRVQPAVCLVFGSSWSLSCEGPFFGKAFHGDPVQGRGVTFVWQKGPLQGSEAQGSRHFPPKGKWVLEANWLQKERGAVGVPELFISLDQLRGGRHFENLPWYKVSVAQSSARPTACELNPQ